MPPKARFTRDEIINSALDLVREKGANGLNARSLAQKLGSSSKPIFSLFENMEELRTEVIKKANTMFYSFIQSDFETNKYPEYKAMGMAYTRFAKDEKELYKLLFMRDRTGEQITENSDSIAPIIKVIQKNLGISKEKAEKFHLHMWIYIHGIATMIATNYLEWDADTISSLLTDFYTGLKLKFLSEENNGNIN